MCSQLLEGNTSTVFAPCCAQGVPPPQENATTVTFYDYPRGANLIHISPDSNNSDVLWDLELDSHQSYYFTPTRKTCFPMQFPVGILRPDWLANATFLGLRDGMHRAPLGARCLPV